MTLLYCDCKGCKLQRRKAKAEEKALDLEYEK